MRINIYDEELTNEVKVVSTTAETGKTFYGVRIFLKSHPDLHHVPEDDDRSAITFWVRTLDVANVLKNGIQDGLDTFIKLVGND
jgi:hypothetical protein